MVYIPAGVLLMCVNSDSDTTDGSVHGITHRCRNYNTQDLPTSPRPCSNKGMNGSEEANNEVLGQRNLLLEIFGVPFLSYVLNLPSDGVVDFVHQHKQADSLRSAALNALGGLMAQRNITAERTQQDVFWRLGLDVLALRSKTEEAWPNRVRLALGGDCTIRRSRGDHRILLQQLARDVYPMFLIPARADDPFTPSLGGALHQHPDRADLEAAILADSELTKLFPQEEEHSGRIGMVFQSTGSGGTLQLWTFPELLLRSGWQKACHAYKSPSLQDFVDGVLWALDTTRRAVQGKPVTVPVRIGLAGVTLAGTTELELPWGRIRPLDDRDKRVIPPHLEGELSTTLPTGESIVINYQGDLVVEMDLPYSIVVREWDSADDSMSTPEWPVGTQAYQLIRERLESLQLGLLLGVDRTPRPVVKTAWTSILQPLSHGGTGWNELKHSSLSPARLSAAELTEWNRWTELVSTQRTPSVAVAITRSLRAATERNDPSDALLDAVIAWENLVGADGGETTLRIATSLACLLGSDPTERAQIDEEVRRLYGLRSKIVHGNPKATMEKAAGEYQHALDITLKALRKLFEQRPELLSEKTSADRSRRLMLDT